MCGRNLSSETSSTIGEQRRFNYALQPMTRGDFVRMMTTDLPEAPAYFGRDAKINREGPAVLRDRPPLPALGVEKVEELQTSGAYVIDTRSSLEFGAGHVPGSLHIGLSGQFASWAGTLLPADARLVLVAEDPDRAEEARMRLSRVGFDRVEGRLDGGIPAWVDSGRPLASTEQISASELHERLREEDPPSVLDVRRAPEWEAGHIPAATHIPLARLEHNAGSLPPGGNIAIICASGYRSSIAASLLERDGFRRISNVVGGMNAWSQARLPLTSRV
jgi:rhodanese-related sulfurtransferase